MDQARLRNVLRPLIYALKDRNTHATLPSICEKLGLPPLGAEGSKGERINASFDALSNDRLPCVVERLFEMYPPEASIRNKIQDLIWNDSTIEIPKKTRREVARALVNQHHYVDAKGFDHLIDSLWVLDNDPMAVWGGSNTSLRAAIEKHVYHNPEDWTPEYLFEQIGALEASDWRFARFLEGLASSSVRTDESAQRHFVQLVNTPLQACGIELRETDSKDGYPVFTIVSNRAPSMGRPKNLIFASPQKPDLRFRDAVNNDIEIVSNSDKVLIYDRPIGVDGLRWCDLQSWWSETTGTANDDVSKRKLYKRLRESLPDNSPPQILLFEAFYKGFGKAIPSLPALLPEVWLHWDPKTVKERGRDALMRFRMDFLLLLPHGTRVVIEVDGKHHYATDDGRADCGRYAKMVEGDRDLQLSGYQVFRFGAAELKGESSIQMVQMFFKSLFKRFGIPLH